jgi:hypothetical protein
MILDTPRPAQVEKEIWKSIIKFQGYEVSNRGRVRSYRRGSPRMLGQGIDRDGYKTVALHKNGTVKHILVHRLVLEVFAGPRPPGKEGRHGDRNPSHNDIRNLRWGTHKENMEDMARHGSGRVPHPGVLGKQHPFAVSLTKRDVRRIVRFGKTRLLTRREIARKFDVSKSVIDAILGGYHWLVRGASI